jgi:hypothetical protein
MDEGRSPANCERQPQAFDLVRSVRILAPELHRLSKLHRLIDQIRPWCTKDTIDGLREIDVAAGARLRS